MHKVNKTLVFRSAAVVGFLAICLFAYFVTEPRDPADPPWFSIVPPLVAVTLALVTGRILLSLGAAVLAGGLLSAIRDSAPPLIEGVGRAGTFVLHTFYEPGDPGASWVDHLYILLFTALIVAMVSLMLAAGALQGMANWLMKYARSARSTRLVTMGAGLVIFFDDYANTLIVGAALRPATDRQRISREKLAFLVDATAAPIAGIALISTWIGYEVGLLGENAAELGVAKDGYDIFLNALGFRFYCILMITFVFFNAVSGADFGPMARAERRARTEGKLLDDDAKPMTSHSLAAPQPHPNARHSALVAVAPIAALLAFFVGGLSLSAAGNIYLLACASGLGLLVAMALARVVARIPRPAVAEAVWVGFRRSLLPLTVLVLAWSLTGACDDLLTGEFLNKILTGRIPTVLFPGLVFVVAAVTSFATGTSWGTMGILIPLAMKVALSLEGGVYGPVTFISMAAVLDGSIFGDHCSPISDTTILSSTASACDHLAHVRTQIPYSLAVAGLALVVGYLPAATGVSKWVGILGGAALSGLLFLGLWGLRTWRKKA